MRDVDRRKTKSTRAAPATQRVHSEARQGEADGGRESHRLIELQRQVGNAAVVRLIQRTPKDRPASTDAPWIKKRRSSKPKPKPKVPDVQARIIKYEIDEGRTLITIASGPDQGVQVGMSGSLLAKSGREVADFTVESASGRISKAHIRAIPDEIVANPRVVIKASQFEPESMEGKEF
jgi:hypothetical protein